MSTKNVKKNTFNLKDYFTDRGTHFVILFSILFGTIWFSVAFALVSCITFSFVVYWIHKDYQDFLKGIVDKEIFTESR